MEKFVTDDYRYRVGHRDCWVVVVVLLVIERVVGRIIETVADAGLLDTEVLYVADGVEVSTLLSCLDVTASSMGCRRSGSGRLLAKVSRLLGRRVSGEDAVGGETANRVRETLRRHTVAA